MMMDGANTIRSEELRSFVERKERLRAEKKDLSEAEKVVMAEAKASGYSTRYINAVVKLRQKSPSERDEDDAMMEVYLSAMGMVRETPLFRHVAGMGVDLAAREKVIEALSLLVPEDGEITVKVGSGARMRLSRDKTGVHVEEVRETPPAAAPPAPFASAARPGVEVPNCSPEQAFEIGRQARRDDAAIIANPFPWDDLRRRHWDEGWRTEDGGDGMGPK
jgi:uncharacterized protein (UPF0335 family)